MSIESATYVVDDNLHVIGTGGKHIHNEAWKLNMIFGWLKCTEMLISLRLAIAQAA